MHLIRINIGTDFLFLNQKIYYETIFPCYPLYIFYVLFLLFCCCDSLGAAGKVLSECDREDTMSNGIAKKLTDKQMKLVDTLVAKGCSVTQAAKDAGYATGESGRVRASKALRQPHVQ
mgnify:CR=1 FL=1